MNPPSEVKILGVPIGVVFKEDLIHDGLCQYNDCLIEVKAGQLKIREVDAVVHELLHMIDYMHNLKLTESQVHRSATALIALLADNPKLLEYIKFSIENPKLK